MGYTVFDATYFFKICGSNLTAPQAMNEMLTFNGLIYEIVESDYQGLACWRLYHSDLSATATVGPSNLVRTEIFSLIDNKIEAVQEIAERVIEFRQKVTERGISSAWVAIPDVMTDQAFNEMMADI
jgi:hypothetical protein